MSFWDGVKAVVSALVEQVKKKEESILRYKERYKDLDDDSLIKKYRLESGDKMLACGLLLKERGYTSLKDL